ncbi:MCE family protein [Actinomadura algeriensis]|uniref:Phospholipid/cholesterol/gamma-HCH transport system substrate-binding protein n=1 Tax=Actinomadura algeriensis TaxID=1679523 RepID=A0ABR9JKA0_9ACTN|nr:MCE family protein [Actinomadura algeriensis]MBE1530982.1 phospholipid/cholesterol/gamma-HCH transport system substrate-binding protein [Actinomadura algeriensis]
MRGLILVLVAVVTVTMSGCSYRTAGAPKGDLTLTAEFDDVQGLVAGHSVQMSDIKVGSVVKVELVEGYRAEVTLSIEDGYRIPQGTRAEIKVTSLLGENFVDLQMPPGRTMDAGPFLADGGAIADTRVQPAFEDVVGQAGPLIKALGGDDLATVVNAGATALDGNGQKLNRTIAKASDLVQVFADQRRALAQSVDQFAKLGRDLAEREDVLSAAPEQIERTTRLLDDNKEKIISAVDELTKAARELNNKVLVGRIERFRELLQDIDPVLAQLGSSRKRLTDLVNGMVEFETKIPLATYDGQLLLYPLLEIVWPDGTPVIPGIGGSTTGGGGGGGSAGGESKKKAGSPQLPEGLEGVLPDLKKILEPRR